MVHLVLTGGSNGQTNVVLGNAVEGSKFELLEAIIPSTFYKVRTGVNDTIDFKYGGVTYAAVLPAGAYTAASVGTAIVTAMTAQVANGWATSYNGDTFLMTISGTSNFTLLWGSGVNKGKSIGGILGFAATDSSGATNSYTGAGAVGLANPFSLYLRVNEIGSNSWAVGGQGFTYRIPMTVESGGIMEADINSDYRQVIDIGGKRTFANLTMTLCYSDGSAVNLNGSSFEIVLKVS